MSSLPAGWYKDPADPDTQRYWDGDGWLGKAIPADAVPPDGPPPTEPEPPAIAEAPAAARQQPQGTPPAGRQPPPAQGWQPPPSQGWQQPPPQGWQQPPQGWQPPPPGWGQQPSPGWGQHPQPPPGWQPPPGMRMAAYPFPVQPRPHGYTLAGLGPRLLARLVDILAVLVLNIVVNGYFAYQWAKEFAPIYRQTMDQMASGGSAFDVQPSSRMDGLLWVMLITATLLWLVYEAPAVAGSGQTLGKRVMRIKVMAVESTEPLGFGRAFGRWARLGLWTLAWGCLGIGLVMQFIDSLSPVFDPLMRQAFHDKTARTVVVALPPGDRQPVDVTSGGGSSEAPSDHSRTD
jgi:uncharacterized RDD family membrane protein YckC